MKGETLGGEIWESEEDCESRLWEDGMECWREVDTPLGEGSSHGDLVIGHCLCLRMRSQPYQRRLRSHL